LGILGGPFFLLLKRLIMPKKPMKKEKMPMKDMPMKGKMPMKKKIGKP